MSRNLKPLSCFLFISLALCAQPVFSATQESKDAIWVNQVFQKGKTYYESGDYPAAVREWNKLDPYLEQYPSFQKVIAYLKSQIRSAPQDDPAERQAWIRSTMRRAQEASQRGDWAGALAEWKKIEPFLDASSPEYATLQKLKKDHETARLLDRQNEAKASEVRAEVRVPAEFSSYLNDASVRLQKEILEIQSRQDSLEKDAVFEQAWIDTTFARGKEAFEAGNYEQAIEEWDKLVFKMKNETEFALMVERLKEARRAFREAEISYTQASEAHKVAHPAARPMQDFLKKAGADLQTQADGLSRQGTEKQQSAVDQQKRVNDIFEKGKSLYLEGKHKDALAEWGLLSSYFEADPVAKASFLSAQAGVQAYERALGANQSAVDSGAYKLRLPDGLYRYLDDATDALAEKSRQAEADRKKTELAIASKRAELMQAFERGKELYAQGLAPEAAAEWKKIAPWIENGEDFQASLKKLEANAQEAHRQALALEEVRQRTASAYAPPAEFTQMLLSANEDLKKQARTATSERILLQQAANDKQSRASNILYKANLAFKAGKTGEAVEEWKKLLPFLDPLSQDRTLIESAEQNYLEYRQARQAAEAAAAKKDETWALPKDTAVILEDAMNRMASGIQEERQRRSKLEKETQEERALLNTRIENSRKALALGKWGEALEGWEALAEQWESPPAVREKLAALRRAWKELQETRASNEQFVATQYNDLKISFAGEMEKALADLDGKIRAEMETHQAERSKMEKSLSERQGWAAATFEKGKAYYEVGKYKEAIEFWSSLAPHMKDEFKVQSLIAGLGQRYQSLLDAQKAAEAASAAAQAPLPAPADLPALLTELTEKINALSLEAMSKSEKAGRQADEKRLELEQIHQKAKAFYDGQEWQKAIETWSALPPYLAEEAKIRAALDDLAASYRNYSAALQAAQEAETRLAAKASSPPELNGLLADAVFKLDKERQVTELARERTDKGVAEKQASGQKLYEEGKAFYDQGKLADAFAAWRSLAPSVENQRELEELLTKADQSYHLYVSAKEQNQQSIAKKEMKLEAPAELTQILETANQGLRDQIFDLKTRSAQTEKMLEDRKNWIDVTYQKGKLAYTQGRYQEAVAEWKTMLPFVENGTQLEQAVSDFERNLGVSLESSKTHTEAEAKKNAKFPPPDELGVLLVELNEKVKNEALEAGAEKIRAEQQFSERQKWMKQTFELGKAFYLEGKYDSAIAEWEKLSAYFEESSGIRKLIEAVKESYQQAAQAKKAAVEAAAGDYEGLKLPYAGQMSQLLGEADVKLKQEASAYQTKKGEMEKTLAERQEWSTTTFNRGKVFYDQGRYEEALGQWERLLPYLEEGSSIKSQVLSLRDSLNTINAGKNAYGETGGAEPPVKLKNESELLTVLEEAAAKFKADAEEARRRQLDAQKSLEQRRDWIEFTFKKGRTFYDQGNYAKAVEEWGILAPYLSEHPEVREKIEEAKTEYSEGRYAQQIIDTMEARQRAQPPLPASAQVPVPADAPEEPASPPALPRAPQDTAGVPEAVPASSSEGGQLVSGELVSVDEPQSTLTLKLFTESGTDETMTIHFDEQTQLDGSETRSVSALQNGAAIDVRYNPQTSHAQYIYVY